MSSRRHARSSRPAGCRAATSRSGRNPRSRRRTARRRRSDGRRRRHRPGPRRSATPRCVATQRGPGRPTLSRDVRPLRRRRRASPTGSRRRCRPRARRGCAATRPARVAAAALGPRDLRRDRAAGRRRCFDASGRRSCRRSRRCCELWLDRMNGVFQLKRYGGWPCRRRAAGWRARSPVRRLRRPMLPSWLS